ncbi:hypothetical protein BC828DRAFT_418430 [Blastocladiella britannica]|nr:hypothetical protein BC828DRAFT_418430 [Blastocladiella britannica]
MIDDVADNILAHAAGATFSPEEAMGVINMLPKHRAPSVLAAVLSRGFLEYRPELAIKHGHGLALLPHYPVHALFDGIYMAIYAAGALGSLGSASTPSSKPRSGTAVLAALEWISRAARTLQGDPIDWTEQSWNDAVLGEHSKVVLWAAAQGHIKEIHGVYALISSRNGNTAIMDWWIASTPEKKIQVILKNHQNLVRVTTAGAIAALDWWWTYTAAKLPDPQTFGEIANAALASGSTGVVEWWWTRFLEHRTPEHTFKSVILRVAEFQVANLDWFWKHYHQRPEYFAPAFEQNDACPHGLLFTVNQWTPLPVLQWAVDKCAELGGSQKFEVSHYVINGFASAGQVDKLDLLLRSVDGLTVEWPQTLVLTAVQHGQPCALEWCDRNQDKLPPQDLVDYSFPLNRAAYLDAVEVLAWWHARFPTTNQNWQSACIESIRQNGYRVQSWFRDHPELLAPESDEECRQFVGNCLAALENAKLFTLDFFDTLVPDLEPAALSPLPIAAYTSRTRLHWVCGHANVMVASLLPLESSIFEDLLQSYDYIPAEWWLHKQLAAGHRVVFPSAEMLEEIYESDGRAHWWVQDVAITRKIALFVESEEGIVPYEQEILEYLQ